MRYRRDVEARLLDLAALSSAQDAGELYEALVLSAPAAYEREPTLPFNYFCSVHGRDPEGSATTAMLLVTDPRWVPTSGALVALIEASGIVTDDDLDLLAKVFVSAGPQLYWACPEDWFTGLEITLDLDDAPIDGIDGEENPPAVVARTVPAGARRWAAERMLGTSTSAWPSLLMRAKEMGGPNGAAIMRGMLDAIETLPAAAAQLILTESLTWGRADVRLEALHLLAAEDPDGAQARAAQDPNEKIRRLGTGLGRRSDERDRGATTTPLPAPEPAQADGVQPALF